MLAAKIVEGSALKIEKAIASYLTKYGNTKEADLINYGVQRFGVPPETVKKAVDRMAIKGRIHRVVHDKLKPPEVYVTLEERLLSGVARQLMEVDSSVKVLEEDTRRILEEAAEVAGRNIRENRKER